MRIHRIIGVVLRYLYLFKHSLNRLADAFYWPVIDLLLWGLTASYMKKFMPGGFNAVTLIISGILLWLIVWRGQYEISVNLLEELWNRNVINIFGTPLKFSEWVVAVVLLGLIKAVVSFAFASLVAFYLYQVKVFVYGFYLLPFMLSLSITGWWVGFLIDGLIFRFGGKVEQLAWSMIYVISPFSGIYYSISILPLWAQKVAGIVPTSYIFEGARQIIGTGVIDSQKLFISLGLNIIYLVLSLIFLRRSYGKALDKGLVKML